MIADQRSIQLVAPASTDILEFVILMLSAARQEPLFPRLVDLAEAKPLKSPERLIYSTKPFAGICSDGKHYVIKGSLDPAVVKAEAAAYILAPIVGIPVPEWTFVSAPQKAAYPLFGSRMVPGVRDVSAWLESDIAQYQDILAKIIVFDIWIANTDRNLGNLISRSTPKTHDGRIDLIAIDFEKAVAVRSATPRIDIASVQTENLWPSDQLGRIIGRLPKPEIEWISTLGTYSLEILAPALQEAQIAIGLESDWHTNIAAMLVDRAAKLPELIEEVWH